MDCEAVRVSMWSPLGSEYFAILPRDHGKKYRERRAQALELIETAIERGHEPGEVGPG